MFLADTTRGPRWTWFVSWGPADEVMDDCATEAEAKAAARDAIAAHETGRMQA